VRARSVVSRVARSGGRRVDNVVHWAIVGHENETGPEGFRDPVNSPSRRGRATAFEARDVRLGNSRESRDVRLSHAALPPKFQNLARDVTLFRLVPHEGRAARARRDPAGQRARHWLSSVPEWRSEDICPQIECLPGDFRNWGVP
jgi:hypothetical protein